MGAAATFERRFASEVRASGRRLEGYAARFNVMADLGAFREQIEPGAFTRSLSGDVLALLDHDTGKVLGRTRSGTLRLSEDARGLHFSLDVPDTQAGRDVLALAERGDLGGMSFGFAVPPGGEEWGDNLRRLREVELREISVVSAWPAYPETEIAVRTIRELACQLRLVDRRKRALVLAEAKVARNRFWYETGQGN